MGWGALNNVRPRTRSTGGSTQGKLSPSEVREHPEIRPDLLVKEGATLFGSQLLEHLATVVNSDHKAASLGAPPKNQTVP